MGLVSDYRSISKLNPFATLNNKVNWIHVSFWREWTVAPPSVQIVRPGLKHIGYWRVVTYLFHVDLSAVIMFTLIRLTQNRVQWFIESMTCIQKAQATRHNELHSLHWVCCQSSSIHVSWTVHWHRGDHIKQRFGRHARNWKTNAAEIEFTRKDDSTNLLDYVFECCSIPA